VIAFLQPLALLGLAAVALPPLLHLIGRRTPPTVVFPAVQYLTATEREHSRKLKLRNLVLLLVRMALIAFLVLAAARPVATLGVGRAHAPTAMALVLDNSLSSGAVADGRTVLSGLVRQARRIAEQARPGDRLWLVLADGVPRPELRADLLATLDSVQPSPLRLDLHAAVAAAAQVIHSDEREQREVVVVSDLQASALPAGEVMPTSVLVSAPPPVPLNRGIDSAYVEPEVWSPDGSVVVVVGGTTTDPTAVRLVSGESEIARGVGVAGDHIVLGARGRTSGWLPLVAELDPDELRADDRWWVAVHVGDPAAVAVEPAAGAFVADAIAVLREGGRVRSGADVTLATALGPSISIVFPPTDPAVMGALNRTMAARGVHWRFGQLIEGEWQLEGDVGPATGASVYRRYRLEGDGRVLVTAGGEPWLVRDGDVLLVASRLTDDWSTLPITAGFVPFLDRLLNRIAVAETWIVKARPGEGVVLPDAAVRLLLPDGAVSVTGDRSIVAPTTAGVLFLAGAGGDTVGALEVNVDHRESALRAASPAQVRAALGENAQVLGETALDREVFGAARRSDLAGLLLIAALAAALAEMVIGAVGHGRRMRDAADAD